MWLLPGGGRAGGPPVQRERSGLFGATVWAKAGPSELLRDGEIVGPGGCRVLQGREHASGNAQVHRPSVLSAHCFRGFSEHMHVL